MEICLIHSANKVLWWLWFISRKNKFHNK